MGPKALALIAAVLLGGACARALGTEGAAPEGPRARAEQLLTALRTGDWGAAARFVHLDGNTRARMGIASRATTEEARPRIEAWFKALYETVRPGPVHSVRIDPSDPTQAIVSYRAGDLDAFIMRFVDGEWFYVLR